jgi:hypothetical protein
VTRPVHLDNLRRVDPITLEILVQDALRRPITQLSGVTLASLCALTEVEELPKALRKALLAFNDRTGQELADLPDGGALDAELAELEPLPATEIPAALRQHIDREANAMHRSEAARKRLNALLESWLGVDPEPVTLGRGRPVIQKSQSVGHPEEPRRRAPAARETSPRTPKEDKPTAPRAAPVRYVDEARQRWIQEQILERLSSYLEHGLLEDVLVAGVRHRARATYPDLTSNEVVSFLKDLQNSGRARVSAGRWRRVLGGW